MLRPIIPPLRAGMFLVMMLSLASLSCTMPDYLLNIRMNSPDILPLGHNSMAIIQLYGYNTSVADAPATPINAWREPLYSWGQEIQIAFSDDILQETEYRTGNNDQLGFYISVHVDNNSDGKICNDTDYQGAPPGGQPRMFSQDDKGEHSLEYELTQYRASNCINVLSTF